MTWLRLCLAKLVLRLLQLTACRAQSNRIRVVCRVPCRLSATSRLGGRFGPQCDRACCVLLMQVPAGLHACRLTHAAFTEMGWVRCHSSTTITDIRSTGPTASPPEHISFSWAATQMAAATFDTGLIVFLCAACTRSGVCRCAPAVNVMGCILVVQGSGVDHGIHAESLVL